MTSYRKQPSAGFVVFCLTACLVVAFFIFGFSTPDLDRIWSLHHLLKTGEMIELAPEDKKLLSAAMQRHPRLTRALLGGAEIGIVSAHLEGWIETSHVTVLRTAQSNQAARVLFDIQTPEEQLPVAVEIAGARWREERNIRQHGKFEIGLPTETEDPEIIEITLRGSGAGTNVSDLGIRITFEGNP